MTTEQRQRRAERKAQQEKNAAQHAQLIAALENNDPKLFYSTLAEMHGKDCACPNCSGTTREAYFPD